MKFQQIRPYKAFLIVFVLSVSFLLNFVAVSLAQTEGVAPDETVQTNPKSREIKVTASVSEDEVTTEPPPPPVLISPENGSLLGFGKIKFKWELQEHDYDYARLELHLNGELLYDDLATSNEENDEYRLQVDGLTYSLTLQPDKALSNGVYTWKVRVIDVNDEGRDSSTWSFTVDTQAPPILITQIDEKEYSISSLDETTIPTAPITVSQPQPPLVGRTDANARVQMNVVFQDGREQTFSTTADENGVFGFSLPYLTKDQVVDVTFIAIDLADNTSVLEGIQIMYVVPQVVIPIVPPGLFPDPPTVTLPVWPIWQTFPRVQIPPLPPLPEPVQEIIEPAITPSLSFVSLAASWIAANFWWLYLLVILLIIVYLALLYYLTGSPWNKFGLFVKKWPRWWLRGWEVKLYNWRDKVRGWPLPGFVFTLFSYQPGSKKINYQTIVTNLDGQWSCPEDSSLIWGVEINNQDWLYPGSEVADNLVDALQKQSEYSVVSLQGQNWWWRTPNDIQQLQPSDDLHLLRQGQNLVLVAWAQPRKLRAKWWRYLPRLALLFSLALTVLVLIVVPSLVAALWFLLVVGILARDWQWYIPQRWLVYTKEKLPESKKEQS